MYQITFLLLMSSVIAIGAFTFSNILNQPDHLFGKLDGWLFVNLPEYIYKPLIGCQYCVAGQWMLWYYLLISFVTREVSYRLDIHILLILFTIFLEEPITFIYYKIFKS